MMEEVPDVKRNTIIAIAVAVAIAVAAFLVWRHVTDLGERLTGLSGQVEELGKRAEGAETRANAAEARAAEAEARAESARSEAGAAAESAAAAAVRERESAEQAKKAETARQAAEERERRAAEERKAAELLAQAEEAARKEAEARELAAQKERAEAQRAAEAAHADAERAKAEKEALKRQMERELDRMESALGRIAKTRRTALGVVMTLDSSQIEFDFDKAELRPRNREVLARIAGVLLTFDNYGVQIFGHTDNIGTAEYNKKLSEKRAATVRDYLVKSGVSPDVISTLGMGKSSPLVKGTDPASRQRNRRVELAIVFSEGEYEAIADDEAKGD